MRIERQQGRAQGGQGRQGGCAPNIPAQRFEVRKRLREICLEVGDLVKVFELGIDGCKSLAALPIGGEVWFVVNTESKGETVYNKSCVRWIRFSDIDEVA